MLLYNVNFFLINCIHFLSSQRYYRRVRARSVLWYLMVINTRDLIATIYKERVCYAAEMDLKQSFTASCNLLLDINSNQLKIQTLTRTHTHLWILYSTNDSIESEEKRWLARGLTACYRVHFDYLYCYNTKRRICNFVLYYE